MAKAQLKPRQQVKRRTKTMLTLPWMVADLQNSIHNILFLHNAAEGNEDVYASNEEALGRIAQIAEYWARDVRSLVDNT